MATETVHTEVTADLIARGVRQDAQHCPIALALKGQGRTGVAVDDGAATWGGPEGVRLKAALPDAAADFVARFDKGEPVTPVAFKLTPAGRGWGGINDCLL